LVTTEAERNQLKARSLKEIEHLS